MRIFLWLSITLASVPMYVGCNNTNVPEELKNLSPVTITVMDGTHPMEGVAVTLNRKGSQGAFACTGVTDAKGVANILSSRSSYTGNGVPSGAYTVVLVKTPELPADLEPLDTDESLPASVTAAKQAKRDAFLEKNPLIPKKLTLSGSSPIELTIAEKSGVVLTLDIAQHQ